MLGAFFGSYKGIGSLSLARTEGFSASGGSELFSINLAYRWFIGYPLNEAVPHFSTVSYNFKHRFNHATVEYVFRWVLDVYKRQVLMAMTAKQLWVQHMTIRETAYMGIVVEKP